MQDEFSADDPAKPPKTWPEWFDAAKKIRAAGYPCGFTAGWITWTQIEQLNAWHNMPIGTAFIYRELLKQIVAMFKTGKPPLDPSVTLEIVAFIEAANRSGANHGAVETVKT